MEIEDKRTDGSVEFSKIKVGETFYSVSRMNKESLFIKMEYIMGKTDCNSVSLVDGYGMNFPDDRIVYSAKAKVVVE